MERSKNYFCDGDFPVLRPLYFAEFQFRYNKRLNPDIFWGSGLGMLMGDRPLIIALAAIVFALLLNVGVSSAEAPPPNEKPSSQITQSSNSEASPESREALATEVIARYTVKLALLTGVLAVIGIVTSAFTLWQIVLARAEFSATHRPQIVVHSVKYNPTFHDSADSDLDKIGARVIFYNTGAARAKIERITYSIAQRRLPLESGINPHQEVSLKHTRIESGIGDHIELGSDIEVRMATLASDAASKVVLIGKIFYKDGAGGLRQTGFCRVLVLSGQNTGWMQPSTYEFEYEYGY